MKYIKLYIFPILIFTLIFISIYGLYILNPFNIVQLITINNNPDNDLQTSLIGALAFINSDYPLFYAENVDYPFDISVLFLDCIPIFAVFFKFVLSLFYNSDSYINFQYFGLFGLLCFLLQGLFAFLIMRKVDNNSYLNPLLISIFFTICPPILYRFPYQTSLSAHFLILASFIPFFFYNKLNRKIINLIYFTIGFLAAGIHLYFIPIILIIVIGFTIYDYCIKHNKLCILTILSYCLGGGF